MKIVKKQFRFGLKLSKNYQSIDLSEGFEAEFEENNLKEIEYFEAMCNDLKLRVTEQAKKMVDVLEVSEPKPEAVKKVDTIAKLKGME